MPAKWQQWMPFHIDKFMGSRYVQAMQPSARAGYLYLLAAQWQSDDCSLPKDEEELAVLSGLGCAWQELSRLIMRHFSPTEDGRIRNAVLFEEWSEAKRVFDARRNAADKTNARTHYGDRTVTARRPRRSAHTRTDTETVTKIEEQKAKPTALSGEPDVPASEFANCWNRNCGTLPRVSTFTDSRRDKILTRQRQGVTLEEFEKAVKHCAITPFLRGDNRDGWRADFDWLIDNDKNLRKVLEGKHDAKEAHATDSAGGSSGTHGSGAAGRVGRTLAAAREAAARRRGTGNFSDVDGADVGLLPAPGILAGNGSGVPLRYGATGGEVWSSSGEACAPGSPPEARPEILPPSRTST